MTDTVKKASITLVNGSTMNWQGIYVDSELFIQGQFNHADMLLIYLWKEQILIKNVEEKTVDSAFLTLREGLPQRLEDCVFC